MSSWVVDSPLSARAEADAERVSEIQDEVLQLWADCISQLFLLSNDHEQSTSGSTQREDVTRLSGVGNVGTGELKGSGTGELSVETKS